MQAASPPYSNAGVSDVLAVYCLLAIVLNTCAAGVTDSTEKQTDPKHKPEHHPPAICEYFTRPCGSDQKC